jgi:hypothetical protein
VGVQIMDGVEPYGVARAIETDDDHTVGELKESDIEMIMRFCPGRDPTVHEFNNLSHAHNAYA